MKIRINDPIGLRTGIQLDSIKSYIDSDSLIDQIRIYGTMTASSDIVANSAEPEICCDFLDSDHRVCYSMMGEHAGRFWISRCSTFRIELRNASQYFNWDEVESILIYVVFQ